MLRLLTVLCAVVLATACASSGGVPKPFPGATVPPPATDAPDTEAPVVPADVPAIVQTALAFRGVPYRNGGSDPSGFDCSGFVQYVFAQHGVGLPREVREQFRFGTNIDASQVQPGDLLFFSTVARGPSHVGMAIGDDLFVHAPSSNGVVRVERFSARYWSSRLIGVKRMP